MQTKLKIATVVAMAMVLVAVAFFFVPHQVTIPEGEDIYIVYVEPTLEVSDMDSTAGMQETEFHFSPGDPGYSELIEALGNVRYRNCLKTLTRSTSVPDFRYAIYVWIGEESYELLGKGYLSTDRLYRVSVEDVERVREIVGSDD